MLLCPCIMRINNSDSDSNQAPYANKVKGFCTMGEETPLGSDICWMKCPSIWTTLHFGTNGNLHLETRTHTLITSLTHLRHLISSKLMKLDLNLPEPNLWANTLTDLHEVLFSRRPPPSFPSCLVSALNGFTRRVSDARLIGSHSDSGHSRGRQTPVPELNQ